MRAHRLWTDADNQLIGRMVGEGKSVAEIATTLGRTELSVAIRCEQLELRVNRR